MSSGKRTLVCTFDVDFTDHLHAVHYDELEATFFHIQAVLRNLPDIRTTWFIRMDCQMEAIFGSAKYAFERHASKLNWLRENGHEIAWHHHAYRLKETGWEQETDSLLVAAQLKKHGELAREFDTTSTRMGWGFHTDLTLTLLENLGFELDSSAIPRPKYSWDRAVHDWAITTQEPYYPSLADYRIAGEPARKILEIPISTVRLPLAGDTEPGVMRYINPAYHSELFRLAMSACANEITVLIAHPYECVESQRNAHRSLSFSIRTLEQNLFWLSESGFEFKTISELRKVYAASVVP